MKEMIRDCMNLYKIYKKVTKCINMQNKRGGRLEFNQRLRYKYIDKIRFTQDSYVERQER